MKGLILERNRGPYCHIPPFMDKPVPTVSYNLSARTAALLLRLLPVCNISGGLQSNEQQIRAWITGRIGCVLNFYSTNIVLTMNKEQRPQTMSMPALS